MRGSSLSRGPSQHAVDGTQVLLRPAAYALINSVSQLRLQAANELGETDLPLALEALGRED